MMHEYYLYYKGLESRPSRGAWIEISVDVIGTSAATGRAPRGARGLKFAEAEHLKETDGRAPRGARGLK